MRAARIKKILLIVIYLSTALFFFSANAMGERETLEEAFVCMLHTNPNILENRAKEEAARQTFLRLRGGLLPTFALAYNVGRGKGQSFSPQTLNIGYSTNNIEHKQATVSQLLWDGGALWYRIANARTSYLITQEQTAVQINILGLKAVSAYLGILRARELELVARESLDADQRRVSQAEKRYEGGAGTKYELNSAKVKLEQAQLILSQTELDLANARSAYREVIGHYPPEELVEPREPTCFLPETLEEIEHLSLATSPVVKAERRGIKAARQGVWSARAVVYSPNVTLQMSVLRDYNLLGIPQRTTSTQGFVAVTYNLFNGGQDVAEMRKAVADLCASRDRLESKIREVNAAIEQTWNELQISRQNLLSLNAHLASSRIVVDSAEKEMGLGKRSLLDVMDAENELYNVRLALVNTKYKIKIDAFSLLSNTGLLANYLLERRPPL